MNTNHVGTRKNRNLIFALGFALCLLAIAVTMRARPQAAGQTQATDAQGAPMYRVDPFWPKRLPNRWSMQQVTGLYVDERNDHVWFLNRGAAADGDEIGGDGDPPRIACCVRGPEAIELDPDGSVVHAWGGPGYIPQWPTALQTILVDREGNVWIAGTAAQDSILKFSPDGKLLWDFGHRPPKDAGPIKEDNTQTGYLVSKGRFNLDQDAREIYIINWKRVLVYDMDTGAFKRGWGGHGMPLSEISNDPIPPYKWTGAPPPEEKNFVPDLHFVEIAKDGLVYVGERGQDRISVYTKQGKWLQDFYVSPNTPSRGPDCGGSCRPTPRCLRAEQRTRWSSPKTRSKNMCSSPTGPTIWSGFSTARRARPWAHSAATANTPASSTGSTPSEWTPRGTSTPAKWNRPSAFRNLFL
jgi:hypothetical protein